MLRKKSILYLLAWLTYAVFCIVLFPVFKITVFLFSIPLCMLGGWFYTYKGAVITTLLTIPFHYLLLNQHNPDHAIVEALNPFGIIVQLIFSFSAALLKVTHLRYEELNDTLAKTVEKRTQTLAQLTNYLIEAKDAEILTTEAALIDEPMQQLKKMMVTSRQLSNKLADSEDPGEETASTITELIGLSLEQLGMVERGAHLIAKLPARSYSSIEQLTNDFAYMEKGRTKIALEGNWERFTPDTFQELSSIIQEALNNAFRHANPSYIKIGARIGANETVVFIVNDGKRLPTNFNEGMGIPLMRYHAQRLDASLSVYSDEEKNTRIECIIPKQSAFV